MQRTSRRALCALVPSLVVGALLAGAWASAAAQAANAPRQLTVTTDWLAKHLRDPDLVILHVGDDDEFAPEHIPGARFVSLSDISTGHGGGGLSLELPSPDSLRAALERLGISDNSTVVVYYARDWVTPSTRVIFTLDYAGLGDHARLLDGGMGKWKAEGHPVTDAAAPTGRGHLSALRTRPVVVDGQFVRSHLRDGNIAIVDARAPVFYAGPPHGEHRAGHVPGAVNIPFTSVFTDELMVKPPAELGALFADAGIAPGRTIVAYCHIGQQATAVVFAARTLGYDVKLYDGSFEDWSAHRDFPVDTARAARRDR